MSAATETYITVTGNFVTLKWDLCSCVLHTAAFPDCHTCIDHYQASNHCQFRRGAYKSSSNCSGLDIKYDALSVSSKSIVA